MIPVFMMASETTNALPRHEGIATMNTDNPTSIALVTGGGRGLGRSAALHLARDGADIVLTYVHDEASADAAAAEIAALGRRASVLRLDVADVASFPGFVDALSTLLTERFGSDRFDILVNNAGVGLFKSVAQTTEVDLDRMFAVHLKGPFLLTQALAPLLRDEGRVINLSSGSSRYAMAGMAAYGVMKGGIDTLTLYLAKELGPRGITVNTVASGPILSNFGEGMLRDDPDLQAVLREQTALHRIGEPDDVGGAVATLASHGNRFVTGQRIDVSGGLGIERSPPSSTR